MIGTVDCNVQAKYPSMPLDPMQAYVGSPSSIRVRNVPKRIGDWCIRSVQFVAVYPDASIKTAECKLVGGVWVGTIEGTQTSGRSEKGYSIFASGTDENGNEVNGYCLGKGDVEILKADGTIDPDAPAFYVKLLEEQSEDPKPGEMWFNEDELNIVDANGDVKTFEQPDLSEYRTKLDLSVYAADQTVIIAPDGSVFLPTTPTCSIDGNLAEREWVNGDTRIGWWGYVSEEEWIKFAKFDAPDFTSPVDEAMPYANPDAIGVIVFLSGDEYHTEARTLPTEDMLAKVSQLPTNVAKKGDPVSEFFNDANYLRPSTVNSTGAVQKMWNGDFQTATQYINGDCELWGHYNRTEWEYSDGIYREPHVRYDENGFDNLHWLIYVDVSDFAPMPNCWYETESDALNSTEFSFQYGQEQEYVDAFKITHEGWEKTGDLATMDYVDQQIGAVLSASF